MDESTYVINIPEGLENYKLPSAYLLKYYRDLADRTIWLNDEITGETVQELTHYILLWNREDKGIAATDRKPIHLLFDSPGGDLDAQAAICSMISLSETPVIGVAIGMVASAASLIYLSCHLRLSLKSSYFILHKGSAALKGDFDNIMSSIDDYKKEVEKMVDFIYERSKYTREEIEEHIKKDWYVRIDEALEKGLVDEVITNISMLI